MFLQLLLSLDFWLGALAMLGLLSLGALVFLLAESRQRPLPHHVRRPSPLDRGLAPQP
jgi:hypothetical protein